MKENKVKSCEEQKNCSKNESTLTKVKVLFAEKKVKYFKENITFQSKYCKLKKVLYLTNCFVYLTESIILNIKFYFFKRKYYN